MKHARLVCNQREKFRCMECRTLTSSGYQLIDDDTTTFICKDCYVEVRNKYPQKGESIKQLLSADFVFSEEYDPCASVADAVSQVEEDSGYIGELVPDGSGGWREPTPEEITAMNAGRAQSAQFAPELHGELSTITIRYRFTTDNKLQVILPARCRVNDATYELIVTTE